MTQSNTTAATPVQHTPGPWHFGPVVKTHNHPSGFWNAYVLDPASQLVGIACGETQDETEANARLIAAASELLAALKSCVDKCELQCIGNVDLMRIAIAKAEGRA